MKKERIELRVSKEEKQEIMDEALKNEMSMTNYILSCVHLNMYGINDKEIKSDRTKNIIKCLMDLNDIASEENNDQSKRFLKRLGDLECLL